MDLAGSERAGLTGAEGIRLKEGAHINKSLLSLGTVISKLADGQDGHIPYRDSKLTRILQPSLGGNARTAIICTVTPASRFVEETTSTLKFASRAKVIQNKPEINEVVSEEEALIKKYRKEIGELKRQLNQVCLCSVYVTKHAISFKSPWIQHQSCRPCLPRSVLARHKMINSRYASVSIISTYTKRMICKTRLSA